MNKILCIGMLVCDILISTVPDDILSRDSVGIRRPITSCGGDALNVAMGLSKLGADVMISSDRPLQASLADDARSRGLDALPVVRFNSMVSPSKRENLLHR